ncbi:dynein intermediate chain 2, ciliary isoform X4 [Apis mellifera]|uniref:Dynein intermediate chain 2, ciliary isoform X4 n=1 Tax=Apis mellifera TaxID=7460 RepID=A0A7M7LR13_APIME|nr:dynein intermediate chain 2, ciliary isoform X4 [Apis mellifera]|eukprot:XP_006562333.1 dynein intermediate chain 2, ciliary isoform X4 [Apis mellifera]
MYTSSLKKTASRMADTMPTKEITRHISFLRSRMDIGADIDWLRGKIFLKPEDQLQLTEVELQEEFARVLTIHNTRIPDSLVEWSWKLKTFIMLPPPPHLVTFLSIPGLVLHKDSEEAKIQLAGELIMEKPLEEPILLEEEEEEIEEEEEEVVVVEEIKKPEEPKEHEPEHEHEHEEEEEIERVKPKKIPNQFNFCERAALTYTNPMRETSTQTIPPPTELFNTHVFQWTIFDEYQEDFAQQQREKEKERRVPLPLKKEDIKKKAQTESDAISCRMIQAAKTLERMVNQNIFDEIAQDYRYWDDPSDEFKTEGSLLPLWKFRYEKTNKHDVTYLCFNSRYYDLFAVSYGAMSFSSLITNGKVCLFTLKNPSYPEWICSTDSPVMCLEFSEQHPHLLVIGTMDGSVAVYNIMLPPSTPQYRSNDVIQKHGGIVWEVHWAPDTEEGKLAFYSVSIDGKINYWILNQNDLGLTTVMTLFLDRPPIPGPDGTMITLKGCGTCFAFHPTNQNIFLVGTEEGTIYKCNTAYSSIYMSTYNEAHNMPIYQIVYNKFNSSIFASCSGDWRIKIWEDDRMRCSMGTI